MANIAIIPARGGSKRLAGKNIRILQGKPVIAYPIEAALASNCFDEVMVSTDDDAIAEIARKYGAQVPFRRSAGNSNDHATLADVLLEVVKSYENSGRKFEYVCCLLPTAALVSPDRILEAQEKLLQGGHDSLVPVLRFAFPIQRALREQAGKLVMREPEHLNTRSQDLEPCFHDAGQFYWIKTDALLREKKLYTGNTGYIELGEMEAQDIDTASDWELLELKFKNKNN